jgi:hypothetical protein
MSRTPSGSKGVGQRYPNPNTTGGLWNKCREALVLKPAKLRLGRFGSHALKIFSLGQKSLASAAGIADPKTHRLTAAREEHCLDNRHALHATGTTRHS